MAATGAGHDFVLPGEKAPETKTFGSHAHCCCNDRECEGVEISVIMFTSSFTVTVGPSVTEALSKSPNLASCNPLYVRSLKDQFTQMAKNHILGTFNLGGNYSHIIQSDKEHCFVTAPTACTALSDRKC